MMETERAAEAPDAARQCLHLGRSGERCSRVAAEDGFCERHGPHAVWRFNVAVQRKLFAVLLAAAVLWPILVDLWRAIKR